MHQHSTYLAMCKVRISKFRRFSTGFLCVLVQIGDESSESSQKKVRNAFVVLDSLHSNRLGQVSRTVNVASPEEQKGLNKEILQIKEIINTYLRTAM